MHSKEAVEAVKQTVLRHLGNQYAGHTFGHMMHACGLREGRHTDDWVSESRVLDRALQALKREGTIWYDKKLGWRLSSHVLRSAS
jgi:hypothetical protein